jgi:hypothetical protein
MGMRVSGRRFHLKPWRLKNAEWFVTTRKIIHTADWQLGKPF